MIDWIIPGLIILATLAWIGYDFVKRRPTSSPEFRRTIEEVREDGTRAIERRAALEDADVKVAQRVHEIEKIKHDTEILQIIDVGPAVAPPSAAAPKGDAPAGSSDTTMIRIVKFKVDEAQKLADRSASKRKMS